MAQIRENYNTLKNIRQPFALNLIFQYYGIVMANESKQKITPRAEDYSQWYLDVIAAADMAEHAPVKGCMVIKPYGYAIWENIQKVLNVQFKETGVENAYFPLLIPQSLLTREEDHVEGFAPEVAVVTKAGNKDLEEPLVVRPTSETIMYETFSKWVQSYRDLPVLVNQWANVVRWELRTRLFLRTTEFLWQEGHTVHATHDEADERARMMGDVYTKFAEDYMAIPGIPGRKTESERFAGAIETYTLEAMMQDGKALQFATSHNLGDNFAKAFDIMYLGEDNEHHHAWQTSWGISTRSIGGLIMTHSDDKGLVLPPKIAPIHVVIIPIYKTDEERDSVSAAAQSLREKFGSDLEVKFDDRDHMRPGEKFFEWERKGVPVRIEIGPRDVADNNAVLVRRDTGEKSVIGQTDVVEVVTGLLQDIQQNLLQRAQSLRDENTVSVDSWGDFTAAIEDSKFVLAHWDGTEATEKMIKNETGATIRCIPFDGKVESGVCVKTGEKSQQRVVFAKAY